MQVLCREPRFSGSLPRVALGAKDSRRVLCWESPTDFPGVRPWPGRGSRVIRNLFLASKNDMSWVPDASRPVDNTAFMSDSLTTDRQARLLRVAASRWHWEGPCQRVPASTSCHVTGRTSLPANRVIRNHVFPKALHPVVGYCPFEGRKANRKVAGVQGQGRGAIGVGRGQGTNFRLSHARGRLGKQVRFFSLLLTAYCVMEGRSVCRAPPSSSVDASGPFCAARFPFHAES